MSIEPTLPKPFGYFAWTDLKPCWGEDCVCKDPVYPIHEDDNRKSMPIFTGDQLREAVAAEQALTAKHRTVQVSMLAEIAALKAELASIKNQKPISQERADAMALYTPPFKFIHGYIYDSKNNMAADQGGCNERDEARAMMVAQIRGWGRIGYMPNAAALQDEAGNMLADALNLLYLAAGAQPETKGQS